MGLAKKVISLDMARCRAEDGQNKGRGLTLVGNDSQGVMLNSNPHQPSESENSIICVFEQRQDTDALYWNYILESTKYFLNRDYISAKTSAEEALELCSDRFEALTFYFLSSILLKELCIKEYLSEYEQRFPGAPDLLELCKIYVYERIPGMDTDMFVQLKRAYI